MIERQEELKPCRYCGVAIDVDAVVCTWCGSDLGTPKVQSDGVSSVMPDPHALGRRYGVITGGLIATIVVSGWCWGSQNVYGLTNLGLRDACLGIWFVAGALLTVSQFVFLVMAVIDKEASARTAVMVIALVMMAVLALLVFGLANMPS